MATPRLKKVTCVAFSAASGPCPVTGSPMHKCNREFELSDHEAETLAGVGNSNAMQKTLAKAKHKKHTCACGAEGKVGNEDRYWSPK